MRGDAIGMRLLHPQPSPAQPCATFPPWRSLKSHTEYSELEVSSLPALPPPSPITTPQQVCADALPHRRELMCTEVVCKESMSTPSVTH